MYHYLTSSLFVGHLVCYHSFDSASILTRWKNKLEIGTRVGGAVWLTLREVKGPKLSGCRELGGSFGGQHMEIEYLG